MNSRTIKLLFYLIISIFYFSSCHNSNVTEKEKEKVIIGVKVYPDENVTKEKFRDDVEELIDAVIQNGYNTIFTPGYISYQTHFPIQISLDDEKLGKTKELFEIIKSRNIKTGLIVSVFHDPSAARDVSLIPVDQKSESHYESWQRLVCPSNEEYRSYKLEFIKILVKELKPDIVSLDFIRFPVNWEIISQSDNEIRNFCFCKRCISQFEVKLEKDKREEYLLTEDKTGWIESNAFDVFTEFKCSLITSFVKDVYLILKEISPSAKLSLHIVPWLEKEYNNGLQRIAGQDLISLSEYADIFAPMSYHKMLNKDENFVLKLSDEIKKITGKIVLSGLEISEDDTNNIKSKIDSAGYGRVDFHLGRIYTSR